MPAPIATPGKVDESAQSSPATKGGFGKQRRVPLAVVSAVAVISLVAAGLLFFPGAPLAIYGAIIAGKIGASIGMSAHVISPILLATLAPTITGIVALGAKYFSPNFIYPPEKLAGEFATNANYPLMCELNEHKLCGFGLMKFLADESVKEDSKIFASKGVSMIADYTGSVNNASETTKLAQLQNSETKKIFIPIVLQGAFRDHVVCIFIDKDTKTVHFFDSQGRTLKEDGKKRILGDSGLTLNDFMKKLKLEDYTFNDKFKKMQFDAWRCSRFVAWYILHKAGVMMGSGLDGDSLTSAQADVMSRQLLDMVMRSSRKLEIIEGRSGAVDEVEAF
ncbi:MAG: hypothetical protein HW387_379 [Parachlamydiales bacterium]|nr:hypothetical protein [Parachlamydiales bacterium]